MSFSVPRGPIEYRKPPALVASGGVPVPTDIDYTLDSWAITDRPLTSWFAFMEQEEKRRAALTPEELKAEDLRNWARDEVRKIEEELDRCPHCGHNPNDDEDY